MCARSATPPTQKTKQAPPHTGWRYDTKTRGWYSPRFKSLASAQGKHPAGTEHGRYWIARREYDKEYGTLAKQGYQSYEEKAKTRKEVGLKPGPGRGRKKRGGWRKARYYKHLETLVRALEKIDPTWSVVIDAFGPVVYGDSGENDEQGNVINKWVTLTFAKFPDEVTRDTIERAANKYFADWTHVKEWGLRVKKPDTTPRGRSSGAT